jgi:hypothetical protein
MSRPIVPPPVHHLSKPRLERDGKEASEAGMKSSCVGREHERIVRWRRDDTETDEFRTAHDMTDAAEYLEKWLF